MKTTTRLAGAFACALLAIQHPCAADTSYTIPITSADAFLANGTTGNLANKNFGAAGTLAIAPSASSVGEIDSVIQFNVSAAVNQFNTTYGAGAWQIMGLTLQLASNFGSQGDTPPNHLLP